MKKLFVLALFVFSLPTFASVLVCNNGEFRLNPETGKLAISGANGKHKELRSYLYLSSDLNYVKDGIQWNSFHNAFFASDSASTVKVYFYQNGERAVSLVLKAYGLDEVQIKFDGCNF